jgi:hypothetical protein
VRSAAAGVEADRLGRNGIHLAQLLAGMLPQSSRKD